MNELKNMAKNLCLDQIFTHLDQIWAANFLFLIFFKNLAPSLTRYHVQLSLCAISEKTNNPILEKRCDVRD